MLAQPGAGAGAVVAGQVVGDHHNGPVGVGSFDRGQQLLVGGRVARGCGHRHLLPVTDPEGAVHPGLLQPAAVVQWRFDPVASGVQPAAGGNVRGMTGPSSSALITVVSAGGSVWQPERCSLHREPPIGTGCGRQPDALRFVRLQIASSDGEDGACHEQQGRL